ncbi:MAG: TIGR03016 family PEP-CTERM system-associated outer membrane protein [Pseudomonadota bacterium]
MATITVKFARRRAWRRGVRPIVSAVGTLMLACGPGASSVAQAAEWRFTPTVNLSETYSDNIRLATRGNEESDFVTQISPGFTLTNDGPRLQVRANYALQALLYADSDTSTSLSNLFDATVRGMLVRDLLYFDARGSIGQQNISPFGAQSSSNVNVNPNQAEVRTYSVSPYLVHRFENLATAQLRYTHESFSTSSTDNTTSDLISNTNIDRVALVVNSGPAFRVFAWGAQASTERNDFSGIDSVQRSNISGNAAYILNPALRLTTTLGYEKETYETPGDQPQGVYYNGGFIWTPNPRTNVMATVGRRYFGETFSLAASHRSRRTIFSVNYNEDVTTSQAQFIGTSLVSTSDLLNQLYSDRIADPAARQRVVDAIILQTGLPAGLSVPVNAVTNRFFLQKSLQASAAFSGRRNTIVTTLFNTRREATSSQQSQGSLIGSQLAALEDNSRQFGATALWNLQMSARTSANADVSYTRSKAVAADQGSTTKTARLALTTAFQPKLRGNLEYRRSQQDSDFLGGDIRENAVTASLLMQF